jgi:4-hydroxy-tetrahydrodipicolinate reductase
VTNLAIVGGAGRMGQALAHGLSARGFSLAALVDRAEPAELLGAAWTTTLAEVDPGAVDAVVDFSSPESVVTNAAWCARHARPLVVGTTGLSPEQRGALAAAGEATGVLLCANFSVGAVLAERFAAMAAPFFDSVEVIELHHGAKADAPSGTSMAAGRAIATARQRAGLAPIADPTTRATLEHSRGGEGPGGVRIHSVRLPGLTAHQEILFGGPGEGLSIRHDSYDRMSFVPGVALALERLRADSGFVEGLDSFL